MNVETFIPADIDIHSVALVDGEQTKTYAELKQLGTYYPEFLRSGLVILAADNTIESVSRYLSCVEAHIPVLLLDVEIEHSFLADVVERFKPAGLLGFDQKLPGYVTRNFEQLGEIQIRDSEPAAVHGDLCVMLATSGSTGNPKFVRLSRANVLSNAHAIAQSLGITDAEIAVTSLPFSYTYGLSVINSHIVSGARMCLTSAPVVSQDFWTLVRNNGVTSIAGVPTTYRMLKQMRWSPEPYPSLKYMTQAGGRLPDADRQYFLELLGDAGVRFFVMYGQTEATARMSVAPPELLKTHISTAGLPIPGGTFTIKNPDHSGTGEVEYSGPNVMMGYAEKEDDLVRGQEMPQVLVTGDVGYLKDGALFLVGRTKRIVKIFGVRVSLDDVDRWLSTHGHGVAVQGNDIVVVYIEEPFHEPSVLRADLAEYLKVNKTGIRVEVIPEIPLLASGKIDFQRLTAMATA